MVILHIYSTCWCMKSMFYEHQHILQAYTFAHPRAKPNLKQCKKFEATQV
jgi:hypothetical protein